MMKCKKKMFVSILFLSIIFNSNFGFNSINAKAAEIETINFETPYITKGKYIGWNTQFRSN